MVGKLRGSTLSSPSKPSTCNNSLAATLALVVISSVERAAALTRRIVCLTLPSVIELRYRVDQLSVTTMKFDN